MTNNVPSLKINLPGTKFKISFPDSNLKQTQNLKIQINNNNNNNNNKSVVKRGRRKKEKGEGEHLLEKEIFDKYENNTEMDSFVPKASKSFSRGAGTPINNFHDFSKLEMKKDDSTHPLWVLPDGHIFLETFSPVYRQATDFLISIAAPESRSFFIHQYQLTPFSLFAAVSVGLTTKDITTGLQKFSKNKITPNIIQFINASTENYGKVKLVLQKNSHFVETSYPEVLQPLIQDKTMHSFRVKDSEVQVTTLTNRNQNSFLDYDDEEDKNDFTLTTAHSFEVQSAKAQLVKKRCIELDYPMLEEYDFRNDTTNPNLDIDLKVSTQIRPYQEKSLSKMFGNGRARSGIIVLPCGAGKSLVGITAACTIKKSCLILCTNGTSAQQWIDQFRLWSTIPTDKIAKFTSDSKEIFNGPSGVIVTTYTMVSYGGKRSGESERIMKFLSSTEWGLLLLDEVHVVPATLFRSVLDVTKTHCKLGLTATLVREDNRTDDLNFLIGPKLYEANWMDLSKSGFIASVQCFEVWCSMTGSFYREYLKTENFKMKTLLYVMNPVKFHCTKFLMEYHEKRGDKVIIFADNIWALKRYGTELDRPIIYGKTSEPERQLFLNNFKLPAHKSKWNTILLSKVGDNSIDLPEANVIIQISSHFGSRRQEAQRLGRILRPKQKSEGEFNAYFYSLVSKDTEEMKYSSKRQQFLVDQGYSFKILADLPFPQKISEVSDQKLLKEIKDAGEDINETEENGTDIDDVEFYQKATSSRTTSSLGKYSGDANITYGEKKTGTTSISALRKKLK